MPTIIVKLWENIYEANEPLRYFLMLLDEFAIRFYESEFAVGVLGDNANFDVALEKFAALPFLFMLLALLEAFLGTKIIKFQKLLLGFAVGFSIGTFYIAPVVSNIVPLDHFVIGLAFGIVLAFFRSPLYFVTLASAITCFFYYHCVNLLHFGKFWALLVAAVIVVLVFIFLLKWVELVGTSLLGGWLFSLALSLVIGYPERSADVIIAIIAILVAAGGLALQIRMYLKTKKLKEEEPTKEQTHEDVPEQTT